MPFLHIWILEALNFDFYEFSHFLKAESYQINKIQSSKNEKKTALKSLDSQKLISRKSDISICLTYV